MGSPDFVESRAALLGLALVVAGFVLQTGEWSRSRLPPPLDVPVEGFIDAPGVQNAGEGRPRDALRVSVTGVRRGDQPVGAGQGWRLQTSEARIHLQFQGTDGKPALPERWRFLAKEEVAIEGAPRVTGYVRSGQLMFFRYLGDDDDFSIEVRNLPEGEVVIPRIVFDVVAIPVGRLGRLHWTVDEGRSLGYTFLDRILFVSATDEGAQWGMHSRGRYNPPTVIGTCVQGVLEEFTLEDADGKALPEHSMTGRSWGPTYTARFGASNVPTFPLRVEALWRPCEPSTRCRFTVENVRIPAK